MALSPDEQRLLIDIEQGLCRDDPAFAWWAVAVQWRMRLRQLTPFLLFAAVAVMALILIVMAARGGGAGQSPSIMPTGEATADDGLVFEPR